MTQGELTRLQEGLQLQRSGRLREAEGCYRAVLARSPGHPLALNLLGALCVNSGRPDEAREFITRALTKHPDDPQAHANLGLALKDLERFGEAAEHLRASLRLEPRNPVVHNNLGNVLRALDQRDEAAREFEEALRLDPAYADAWCNLAAVGCDMGRHERALQAVDRALALNPRFAEAHNNRGDILRKLSRLAEAADSYRSALRLKPDLQATSVSLAETLAASGAAADAEAILLRVLEADPRNVPAWHSLGVLREQAGEREAAADAFAAAIAIAPEHTLSHYQLAQLRGRRTTDEELGARERLYARGDLRPEQRVQLAFALALASEERGDYDRAFAYWSEGNRIKAGRSPFDAAHARDYLERIRAAHEAAPAAAANPPPDSGPRPVFVLGLPRSGTSLTEQILASHPAVVGAGEVSYMEDTVRLSGRLAGRDFPESCAALTDAQCAELGRYYLSRHAAPAPGVAWIVDKTPMNFQYVGLIARILPEARIVHCHRDPVANCLSIFQRPFEDSHTYAHDLGALGTYYRQYERLVQFWKERLLGRILDVSYEETVADLEGASRRMLEFLGLPFDEAVLRFHATRRMVRTPSASQVRQPIYSDAVDAWRRYEKHLGPLLDALRAGAARS